MIWFTNWFVKITGAIPQIFAFRKKIYYEDKKAQGRFIKKKAIVVCNHHTVYDFIAMMFLFWTRSLRCLIAEIMFQKNIFLTALLKMLGGIKVERDAHDFSFVNKSLDVLDKNGVVEIFPESRIPKKGEQTPLPFKPSVAYIALNSGAPVIPVYTNGKFFNRERNRIIIGKPIDVREWYDESLTEKENLAVITEKIREKVIWLKNELERQQKEEKKKV